MTPARALASLGALLAFCATGGLAIVAHVVASEGVKTASLTLLPIAVAMMAAGWSRQPALLRGAFTSLAFLTLALGGIGFFAVILARAFDPAILPGALVPWLGGLTLSGWALLALAPWTARAA